MAAALVFVALGAVFGVADALRVPHRRGLTPRMVLATPETKVDLPTHPKFVRGTLPNGLEYAILPNVSLPAIPRALSRADSLLSRVIGGAGGTLRDAPGGTSRGAFSFFFF